MCQMECARMLLSDKIVCFSIVHQAFCPSCSCDIQPQSWGGIAWVEEGELAPFQRPCLVPEKS